MTDESIALTTVRAIEGLAARGLGDEDMAREARAIVSGLGEKACAEGGTDAAIDALERFRETLAKTIAQSNAHGHLQSAYTYAANSIKPVILKITDPKLQAFRRVKE